MELVGAVVMQPDHFITISKVGEKFILFDGVLQKPISYASFGGAVTGTDSVDRSFLTSPDSKYGVHVLLYKKVKEGMASVPLLSCLREPPIVPSEVECTGFIDLTVERNCFLYHYPAN